MATTVLCTVTVALLTALHTVVNVILLHELAKAICCERRVGGAR